MTERARDREPANPLAPELSKLDTQCTILDGRRLRRRWRGLRGVPAERQPAAIEEWRRDVERAVARRAARAASVPAPQYPPDLPVAQRRAEIVAALCANRVVIVCGDTGSGKSTQLPKMCLEAGRGVAGAIAHTQPRRIAARSVGARVAEELGVAVGGVVGVKTRFDDRTGPNTLLQVMTDGLLLSETRRDRDLLAYDTIIVDEAHERSLNIDFLLGYLRQLLERRDDLHLVITSATIDPERFARHFANSKGEPAPVIAVTGRMYPIETRWRPLVGADGAPLSEGEVDEDDPEVLDAIGAAIDEIDAAGGWPGGRERDALVFLSGEREIREAAEALRGRFPASEILPLYARLSAEEQDRIFKPSPRRRIVLATNVAETALTVPRIGAVVDPGLARISRYSPRSRVQRLPIEPISQASADQRRGRCGRVGPGVCVRLYSEEDYAARPRYTPPEILRTNLASVILQMLALSLGAPEAFPFLDPPPQRLIEAGYETLVEIGAVTRHHELTPLGRRMAQLPIDPRLSRMVLASVEEGCVEEVLVIAAALSVQDPRERPADRIEAADFAHLEFRDERSDFLGFLKLWRAWRAKSEEVGSSALRRWCRERHLSWMRMREWTDVHRQLRDLLETRLGERLSRGEARLADDPDANRVHRALLTGLVANVGQKGDRNEYRSANGSLFVLHPSSAVARNTPPWVMAAEIVETSRRFARLCAKIQGDWVERVAPHLCSKSHSEPHWLRDAGQVAAWERVTHGALTVVPRRRVPFGPLDPEGARDIFIRAALVEGELRAEAPFLTRNAQLLADIAVLEAKGRHAALLIESEARFAFYDARVPRDVHSTPSFEKWRKGAERRDPTILLMRREDLLVPGAAIVEATNFPDEIAFGELRVRLTYRHAPGAADDGVTATIPLAAANRVDPARLEWLVPGLIESLVAGLLRTLPKRLRVRFQPAAEFASGAAESLPFGEGALTRALAAYLRTLTGVAVEADDLALSTLEPHLRMRVVIVDETGRVLEEGRDAAAILGRFRSRAAADWSSAALSAPPIRALVQRGMLEWTCPPLPEEIRFERAGVPFIGYPALADEDESVAVRVLERRDEALRSHRDGLRRLLALRFASALEHHVAYLPALETLALYFAPLGSRALLERSLKDLAIEIRFLAAGAALPRDGESFSALASTGEDRLFDAVRDAAQFAEAVLRARHETAAALDVATAPSWADAVRRMREDLARLVPPDVLASAEPERLRHLPRWLAAIRGRLRRLPGNVGRDAELQADIDRWNSQVASLPPHADPVSVARLRFLLEEYRVQRFAGELRTAVPVSPERLAEALRLAVGGAVGGATGDGVSRRTAKVPGSLP